MIRHAWGIQCVGLGAWEAVAYASGRPTVTSLVRRSRGRYRNRTKACVAMWLIGLGVHLLRES